MGRYDDALRHLDEGRDLAERFDNAGLVAWSGVQLGSLAVARGRLQDARVALQEALRSSLATHSTRSVTLCLAALAQLALVEGDAERAALLAGAAEGLRQRVGLRAWPLQRQGEAEMVARIREVLAADRFEQLFVTGAGLNRRQAVAAVGGRAGAAAS
ncbi:MAG TPA: hypothetical protein VGR74_08035 [Actinomycetota bacterium]|jgi:hypothetical protein|nr:hypothetical protein [Actinomycetota bacterium]